MTLLPSALRRGARSLLFRAYDADRVLARAARRGARRFAFAWVRGVGDTAFILNEFARHVQRVIPGAEVTALVRPGLEDACRWIPELRDVVVVPEWSRARTLRSVWDLAFPPPWEIRRALRRRGLEGTVDAVLPYPLGAWYARDASGRRPSLRWTERERRFGEEFRRREAGGDGAFVVALNTSTGTARYYDHAKEWGHENFDALMAALLAALPDARLVLVDGERPWEVPPHPRVVDARGRLSLSQCVSVIVAADLFVGLDTGPANLVYFLEDVAAELIVLVGRRAVFTPLRYPPASPAVRLTTIAGDGEDVGRIGVKDVLDAARSAYARRRAR